MKIRCATWLKFGTCCATIIIASFVILNLLETKTISNDNPEELFKEYICDPIPRGVSDIRCKGSVSFASTSISIYFKVENERVFEDIKDIGGLTPRNNHKSTEEPNNDANIHIYDRRYRGYESVQIIFNLSKLSGEAYYGGG